MSGLTYELAKELKDAGFPQGRLTIAEQAGMRVDPVHFPTLEELIEACAQTGRFIRLNQTSKDWFSCSHDDELIIHESANDSTPTEAVARLYIALNKK